jgi:hypothetical protein
MDKSKETFVEIDIIAIMEMEYGVRMNVEMERLRDGEHQRANQIALPSRSVTVSMNTKREESVDATLLRDAEPKNLLRGETKGLEMMDTVEIMDTRLTRMTEENGVMEETEMQRITAITNSM